MEQAIFSSAKKVFGNDSKRFIGAVFTRIGKSSQTNLSVVVTSLVFAAYDFRASPLQISRLVHWFFKFSTCDNVHSLFSASINLSAIEHEDLPIHINYSKLNSNRKSCGEYLNRANSIEPHSVDSDTDIVENVDSPSVENLVSQLDKVDGSNISITGDVLSNSVCCGSSSAQSPESQRKGRKRSRKPCSENSQGTGILRNTARKKSSNKDNDPPSLIAEVDALERENSIESILAGLKFSHAETGSQTDDTHSSETACDISPAVRKSIAGLRAMRVVGQVPKCDELALIGVAVDLVATNPKIREKLERKYKLISNDVDVMFHSGKSSIRFRDVKSLDLASTFDRVNEFFRKVDVVIST